MQANDLKGRFLPHFIVVVSFLVLVLAYFPEVFFQGKSLKQGDAVQWAGASREITLHREKYGEEPLWTNGMFGGMPAYTISVMYDGELLEPLEQFLGHKLLPYPISIFFFGLICSYVMFMAFGASYLEAAIGAIAFTFFSFNFVSIEAGHNSKVRAMTFAPLVIAGMAHAWRSRYLWGLILTSLGVALQIRSGHYQITYYLAFAGVFYGVAETVQAFIEKRIKVWAMGTLIILTGAGIGVATNAARLLVIQEYTQYSMRGKPELTVKDPNKPKDGGLDKDYVFSWSNGVAETFTLLVPNLYGGSTSEKLDKKSEVYKTLQQNQVDPSQVPTIPYYWGDQPFTSGPVYAGAIVVFLFVLGGLIVDNKYRWWLIAGTIISLFLAMGKSFPAFNYLMYDYFPGYNKFRTVTMSLFIAQLLVPILVVLALRKWASFEDTEENKKKLFIALGISGGLALLFALAPSLAGDFTSDNDKTYGFPQWLLQAVEEDRASMARKDAFRSLAFILLAGGVLWFWLKKKIKAVPALTTLAVLTLVDLWMVDKRYLNKENFEKNFISTQFEPTEADNVMRADSTNGSFRVLNLNNPFAETHTSYYFQSLGGYSPVKIRRYQDLIENDLTGEIQFIGETLNKGATSLEFMKEARVINMLNTRYLKASENKTGVITNPYAMGPAWFVQKVITVKDPNEEIAAVRTIDPKTDAVIDINKFKVSKQQFDSGGVIKQTEFRSNYISYDADNANSGLAVFSEIYYPEGWEFTIDGKEAELIRVNYLFRAAEIPAGKHKLEMRFRPKSYLVGNEISRYSTLLVYGLFITGIVLAFKKKGESENESEKIS